MQELKHKINKSFLVIFLNGAKAHFLSGLLIRQLKLTAMDNSNACNPLPLAKANGQVRYFPRLKGFSPNKNWLLIRKD